MEKNIIESKFDLWKEVGMANFDYQTFTGGDEGEQFVAHAKKYTKQQAVEQCIAEHRWLIEKKMRYPTEKDAYSKTVRWFVRAPDWCDYDSDCGCYSFCAEGERGSFPVWVIDLEKLKEATNDQL